MRVVMSFSLLVAIFATVETAVANEGWSAISRLDPGTRIRVTLKSGEVTEAAFQSATDDLLVVAVAGHERTFDADEVKRVERQTVVRDSNWNGAILGAGLGFAAGYSIMRRVTERRSEIPGWQPPRPNYAVGVGVAAAIPGAAYGMWLDSLFKKTVLTPIYPAPAVSAQWRLPGAAPVFHQLPRDRAQRMTRKRTKGLVIGLVGLGMIAGGAYMTKTATGTTPLCPLYGYGVARPAGCTATGFTANIPQGVGGIVFGTAGIVTSIVGFAGMR